ncbi:LPS export ABC transporter permease LptG [Neiella marina]|uniref:LPS export ABC transporter permease LptG n=1 Tax=Neiella marina TaxID=508461 RepID=A0A8J2U667_9GAMM|nr:LPS export ABC transporter permease LptG [Neiella marina]GGA81427.1 LPS export ABC transporter permease LptG [Neiella marina]
MYSIIDRHIGRTLLGTTSLVLLVLVGLSSLIRFVQQLKHVGKGDYDIVDAVIFMLFSAPRDIEIFFPVCALMGALVGLGMLASHSELVVMQSSGLSKLNISGSVLKTAIPLALLMMAIGEWGVPASERFARELKSAAISGGSILSSKSGTWAKDGDSFVYIGSVLDADELHAVTQYHFDEQNRLQEVFHFREAHYSGKGWQVNEVHHTRFTDSQISTDFKEQAQWNSTLTPNKLSVVSIKPDALPIAGLMDYVDYLKAGKQDSTLYELTMWRKILKPLAVATMMLLALSFIFGPLRTVTMGARIVLGVIAGFAFHLADQLFGPLSVVFAVPPLISAALPSLLFLGFAIYLLRRS